MKALHRIQSRLNELTASAGSVADREEQIALACDRRQESDAARQVAILDALPAHVALLDTRGLITAANQSWQNFPSGATMHDPGHAVGLNYLDLCDGAVGEGSSVSHHIAARIRSVLSGRIRTFSTEYAGRPSGRAFYLTVTTLDADPPNGVIVMHVDITAARLVEENLRASELRFRQMAENIQDVFFLIDPDNSEMYYVSPAYERIWQRNCESLYANPASWADSIHPDDRAYAHAQFFEGRLTGFNFEYRIIRPGGDVRWISARGFPILDSVGKPYRTAGIVSDITERRASSDALHEMESQLRQAQKMEAVGQLAAGVAHEFNNVLQALMTRTAIIRMRAATPDLERISSEMELQIKRAGTITDQLLVFSRTDPPRKGGLDLGTKIRRVSGLLRHLIPETITIVVEAPPVPILVEGDRGQLQQVLLNLAINARDAMAAGGTLTLRAGSQSGEAFLEVEDTGHGMDDATRSRIFEPFFTTKEAGKGTGLGLSVAYGIVKQHGGRIDVSSQPGKGSRFRIVLPSGSNDVLPLIASSPVELSVAAGRVLLVEDEQGVRDGIAALLEAIGYEVIAVGSGEEALTTPEEPAPDLLLSDVTLPGISGSVLSKRLLARWPSLKVVLMSGYLDKSSGTTATERGRHFLKKPFEMTDLTRELALALTEQDYADFSAQLPE